MTRLVQWLWDDAPIWVAVLFEKPAEWLRCKLHGHEEWLEMDGRSHVCVYCNKLLWTD